MVEALDHVQVAMPAGREDGARWFYSGLLGLKELEKPPALASRGGAWFALPDGRQLHLGVEEPFHASKKAHPNRKKWFLYKDAPERLTKVILEE